MALRRAPATIVGYKLCNKCEAEKPVEEFYRNRRMSDGRMGHCKKCYFNHNREQKRQYVRDSAFRLKIKVLEAYGNECFCCGETHARFLTIDHSLNDGSSARKMAKIDNGHFYRWLQANNFPQDLGLRTACWNCNSGRHHNGGICPHEEIRQTLIPTLRLVA